MAERVIPEGAIAVLDHGFVRLDDAMASDLSVVNSARVSFGKSQGGDGRVRRGARPLPHARPARHTVRAQRVPLPHPRADLRRPRVDAAPNRLVQRVLDAICEGDRRLLRSRCRRRALRRSASQVRTRSSRSSRSSPSETREALRPCTSRRSRRTSDSSRRASRESSRGPSCPSAPTPSSIGRSTRGRS